MWTTCRHSVSSGYHADFHEGCYQKHTNPLNCRTSILDISGYHVDFHKRMALSENGRARHGMCELTGHGMAWERHGRGMACVN
jgi:hypothetical protein